MAQIIWLPKLGCNISVVEAFLCNFIVSFGVDTVSVGAPVELYCQHNRNNQLADSYQISKNNPWDIVMGWIGFGYLSLIFNVTAGLACLYGIVRRLVKFYKNCIAVLLGQCILATS